MRKKKRIEITVETHRVLVIPQLQSIVRARCPDCAEPVQMVIVEEAAAAAGVSSRTIQRRMEAGKLHFTETPERLGARLAFCGATGPYRGA